MLPDGLARPGLMQRALDLQRREAKDTITMASSLSLHPPVPQFPLPPVVKLEITQRGPKDRGERGIKKSQQPTTNKQHDAPGEKKDIN